MKTLKLFFLAALLVGAGLNFAACSDDDPVTPSEEPIPDPEPDPEPEPEPEPEPLQEGLWIEDEQVEINSVFMYEYYSGGTAYSIIALSPEKDAPSGDYLYANEKPGFYLVIIRSMPEQFDLMSADGYSITATLTETAVPELSLTSENAGEVLEKGSCTFGVEEQTGSLELDMTLSDGRRLTAKFDASYKAVDAGNTLTIGETSRPIQTAFLAEISENVYGYYFTAQVIDPNPEMITNCSQWAVLAVPGEALTGEEFDLAAADVPYYSFMAGDLVDRQNIEFYEVEAVPGGNCTGKFSIRMKEDYTYEVSVSCTDANGVLTTLFYQGEIAVYEEPETKNEFLVDNEFLFELNSVVIDMRETVYSIYCSSQRGCTTVEDMLDDSNRVVLTLPASMMGENGAGFSQSDDVSICYDGMTLNYQSGATGRIHYAVLDGENLSLEFYSVSPMMWHGTYEGPVTVIR